MYRELPLVFIPLLAVFLASLPLANAAPHCGLVPPRSASLDSSGNSGKTSGVDNEDVIATGWYPGWLGAQLPPNKISFSKYGSLTFAFALTTPDSSVISLDDQSAALLPQFVAACHDNHVNATLSIGGWTGSIYYSSAMATAENRTAFSKAVLGLVQKYDLDGIDFDWEYPNRQGIGCNTISPQDSANFLSFLQQFRQDPVGARISLSVAVGLTPFVGPDGTPLADVSQFAQVLDHIAIMDYDVWGSWSPTVGPNAPLNDACAPVKAGSATSAVQAWTSAGFPASQIALGVAAYGHSFHVDTSAAQDSSGALALYPAFDKSQQPLGDSDTPNQTAGVDQCGNPASGPSGTFNFGGMIDAGFLDASGVAASGIEYRFDNCSQTPFVYKASAQTMISYDDATSFAAKGNFINSNNLGGFAVWHIAGDRNDILLNAISNAMGIVQVCD